MKSLKKVPQPYTRWTQIQFPHATKKMDYFVCKAGFIKSVEKSTGKEKLLQGYRNKKMGTTHLNITLKGDIRFSKSFHQIVAETFLSNPDNKEFIKHLDGDKSNNSSKNLSYESRSELVERTAPKYRTRQSHSGPKLNSTQVIRIRKRLERGVTKKKLALDFGVSEMQIHRIDIGENWGWV